MLICHICFPHGIIEIPECPSDFFVCVCVCLSPCFQGVQTDKTYRQCEEGDRPPPCNHLNWQKEIYFFLCLLSLVSVPENWHSCVQRGKTTTKIITQTFLVHLHRHAAPLSPSARLLFDIFFVWLVLSLDPVSAINELLLFLCFPVPGVVFDCRVQPIKDRNHHVCRGRWRRRRPRRSLFLACVVPRAAAA